MQAPNRQAFSCRSRGGTLAIGACPLIDLPFLSNPVIALLEWPAALLAIINLVLIARRSLWNYPFGIAAALLYFLVLGQARLYSAALLQILLVLVQLFGWWNWSRFLERGDLPVTSMSARERWVWLLGFGLLAGLWGELMSIATDASLPFADALLSTASIASQALLALRRLEGWIVWVAVNIAAIALFISQALFVTAGLYLVLLVLSVLGLRSWAASRKLA